MRRVGAGLMDPTIVSTKLSMCERIIGKLSHAAPDDLFTVLNVFPRIVFGQNFAL